MFLLRWSACRYQIRPSCPQPATDDESNMDVWIQKWHRRRLTVTMRAVWISLAGLALLWSVGCSQRHYLRPRLEPWNPIVNVARIKGPDAIQPSQRALEILRRYGVLTANRADWEAAMLAMQEEYAREPTLEKCYVLAELAYLTGWRAQRRNQNAAALDRYAAAVTYAYNYLFEPRFDGVRNSYDPLFRQAADLYNTSLEASLRLYCPGGRLAFDGRAPVQMGDRVIHVDFAVYADWKEEEIDHIEFVSDYQLDGLTNRHHTYGLGVPLIVVRRSDVRNDPAANYYPPGLSFAATAFLRVHPQPDGAPVRCTLELYDTLSSRFTRVAERTVPLETDLSTPLAYFLDTPEFNERANLATLGLLNPQRGGRLAGLFMVEPYNPRKIPVLLIHGLWSSPATWMEMFNDLRSFPEIRENYQFWFYQYPTGQPFWISAAQLREDLQRLRQELDPKGEADALDFMVLIGHSMGGLVARLQTVHSGDQFWRLVSHRPLEELNASPQERQELVSLFFFAPNPSVRRVVTIATPHRGSNVANRYIRWFARRVIRLPQLLVNGNEFLILRNPGFFDNTDLLTITTSIDSLAPNSPVLSAILQAPKAPWVTYHNVVGLIPSQGLLGRWAADSDGVVNFASAHLPEAASEITVQAHHLVVHQHPRTVLEVRRILLENLEDARRQRAGYSTAAKAVHWDSPHGPEALPWNMSLAP